MKIFNKLFKKDRLEKEIVNLKREIEILKQYQKLLEDDKDLDVKKIEDLTKLYGFSLYILKAYHAWDPFLITFLKKNNINYPYEKGPATLYLESAGIIEKTGDLAKESPQTEDIMNELKNIKDIKGKN